MGVVDNEKVLTGHLPARSLYEYCFSPEDASWQVGSWACAQQSVFPGGSHLMLLLQSWRSMVTVYQPPADGMFSKIVVPTADVIRSSWLVQTTVAAGRPCLFVGQSGTAKTLTVQTYLGSLDAATNIVLNMNFSSRTSSMDVQRAVEVGHLQHLARSQLSPLDLQRPYSTLYMQRSRSGGSHHVELNLLQSCLCHGAFKCVCAVLDEYVASLQDTTEKRTKDTYGPPMGKRLLVFLDDLNMPKVDSYGTQQPIALLKLLIDRKVRSRDLLARLATWRGVRPFGALQP